MQLVHSRFIGQGQHQAFSLGHLELANSFNR
jgi:hypothetical protein